MTSQFISFEIDNNLFGINIVLIREINKNLHITPIDCAPPYMRGLINLRGQIVTVIDLGVRLGFPSRPINSQTRYIVLKNQSELSRSSTYDQLHTSDAEDFSITDTVGLLIDSIGDVITVDNTDILAAPVHSTDISADFIQGVVRLNDRLLTLLKINLILSSEKSALSQELASHITK